MAMVLSLAPAVPPALQLTQFLTEASVHPLRQWKEAK